MSDQKLSEKKGEKYTKRRGWSGKKSKFHSGSRESTLSLAERESALSCTGCFTFLNLSPFSLDPRNGWTHDWEFCLIHS